MGEGQGAQPTHINTDIQLTKIVLSYSQLNKNYSSIYTAEPVQRGTRRSWTRAGGQAGRGSLAYGKGRERGWEVAEGAEITSKPRDALQRLGGFEWGLQGHKQERVTGQSGC